MTVSAAIADSPLRQACTRIPSVQAGGLGAQSVDILFKDASLPRGSAISRRTVMNNVGQRTLPANLDGPCYSVTSDKDSRDGQ
jgi:hypothetical protein